MPASRAQVSEVRNQVSKAWVKVSETGKMVEAMVKKMCMIDDIWQNNDVRFYVPNYPIDAIQREIVDTEKFFEQSILEELSGFIPQNAVICDIGANIGNHTMYWLSERQAAYVYCFEPRHETFLILEKNIQINNFRDKCQCFNFGLSDEQSKLKIDKFTVSNIGGTSFVTDDDGQYAAVTLDSLALGQHIDFMKIDVEGMEYKVLQGAVGLIEKNKPGIFIEIFPNNFSKVKDYLEARGYFLKQSFECDNYLFLPGHRDA